MGPYERMVATSRAAALDRLANRMVADTRILPEMQDRPDALRDISIALAALGVRWPPTGPDVPRADAVMQAANHARVAAADLRRSANDRG